jgi:hypothetical protein
MCLILILVTSLLAEPLHTVHSEVFIFVKIFLRGKKKRLNAYTRPRAAAARPESAVLILAEALGPSRGHRLAFAYTVFSVRSVVAK